MQVRKLDTSKRRDVRAFVRFPFQLYRDCSQWVPPLLPDMRLALNRDKYPFYQQSDADFFLTESSGRTLGRIAVLDNRPYNQYHGSKAAFFYYFETVEDVQVVRPIRERWCQTDGLDHRVGDALAFQSLLHNAVLRTEAFQFLSLLLAGGLEHRVAKQLRNLF